MLVIRDVQTGDTVRRRTDGEKRILQSRGGEKGTGLRRSASISAVGSKFTAIHCIASMRSSNQSPWMGNDTEQSARLPSTSCPPPPPFRHESAPPRKREASRRHHLPSAPLPFWETTLLIFILRVTSFSSSSSPPTSSNSCYHHRRRQRTLQSRPP